MADGTLGLADIAAIGSGSGAAGGWMGAGLGFIGGLILASVFGGGLFGRGAGAALGYENLATSSEVQRGFDAQNSMANQRETLAAVTAGTAQSVATTNQVFHDIVGYVGDKYSELTRDVAGVAGMVQAGIANQNQCCCDTKMLISETAAQNRYDSLLNTNAINATTIAQTQKILDAMAQSKIDALQGRINQLELQAATSNIVRYPSGWTYNAGTSPFCGCMA